MRDEFQDIDYSDILPYSTLSRRDFVKVLGGGIVIFFIAGPKTALEAQRRGSRLPSDFNAFVRIGEDGRVSVFTGKIEMGQGAITSLAQMAAEQLDVSFESVDMVMGDTDLCPYDMGTFGSMTTRFFGPPLRVATAKAKAVLIELAAERLSVPKKRLKVENGVVFDTNKRSRSVTYAQLAKGKKIAKTLESEVVEKSYKDFKISGKPVLRADSKVKVTGEAKFAGDITFPDMLYGRLLRPPAHGATLKTLDTSEAEKIPGVTVIQEGNMVAVVHKEFGMADLALSKIKAEFDIPPPVVDDKSIFKHLLENASERRAIEEKGNIETGNSISAFTFKKEYYNHYVAHAPIETHSAVAKIENGKADIWASTQGPFRVKDQVVRALGFPEENVRVRAPFVGAGFGGKTSAQQAVEAAVLARATGKPVKVIWTRKEEFYFDTFRPASVIDIESGIDNNGIITFWDYTVYYAGSREARHFYNIPHSVTKVAGNPSRRETNHPFGTGPWRAPAVNQNSFARETQIDVMAEKAGIDPVEFRLKNLTDERMIRVLKTAAEKFGWKGDKLPSGNGFGVACGIDSGTYVALIAEVGVDKRRGTVQPKRVVCAQDMGQVINPAGAIIQAEGCVNMGLGYALTEEIRFTGGKILDENFDTYQLPRFSWMPEIETYLIENNELEPQGGGEPAIVVMGGLIANAIYDAVGARLYTLPMTPARIIEAIKQA